MCDRHPRLAEADSPAAGRAGRDASSDLPDWLVHALALIICFLRTHLPHYRNRMVPAWWDYRPDLPLGSALQLAASIRGEFGTAIGWMCRRRGIGPGHRDWPELARAIVAFGGSLRGFRSGLPACGLQWWENPNILPDMIGMAAKTPAADAMALLSSRPVGTPALPPVLRAASSQAEPEAVPAPWGWLLARAGTGPPTGPPPGLQQQIY